MEFDLIERIRARCPPQRGDVALGIGDDAALLDVPADRQLVACTDTLVAGVHFLDAAAPQDIGWKSLAVNLSDLAAMGAEPAWALLALTVPDAGADFVEGFAEGFAQLARQHHVALVGGDTTQGPLSITVTALGWVPSGAALTRGGAAIGDSVFVTGTLGDAAAGLRMLRDAGESLPPRSPLLRKGEDKQARRVAAPERELHPLPQEEDRHEAAERKLHPLPQEGGRRAASGACARGGRAATHNDWLCARLNRPEPRIAAGLALRGVAHACIDVSDGLLADLGHVCAASGVAARLDIDALPISAALAARFDGTAYRDLALTGGDDYELCFTAPAGSAADVARRMADAGCGATCIGHIVAGDGVRAVDARGNAIAAPRAGWEHFR